MPKERTEYRGKEIEVETNDGDETLRVQGYEVSARHEEGGYYTSYLPYEHYTSLTALGRALVDNWSELKPRLKRND